MMFAPLKVFQSTSGSKSNGSASFSLTYSLSNAAFDLPEAGARHMKPPEESYPVWIYKLHPTD
jgi:hypothetical protein